MRYRGRYMVLTFYVFQDRGYHEILSIKICKEIKLENTYKSFNIACFIYCD